VTKIVASAPGKLVLIGEYAVVDGKPAVVAAVDRRAIATVEDADDLRVRGNDRRWTHISDAMLDDSTPLAGTEQPLLVAVLRRLRAMPLSPVHASVSTSSFSSDQGKLGLGSSAAAAVALTRALLPSDAPLDAVHMIARAAHRDFQGGGSGIDVAASTFGGLVRFEAVDAETVLRVSTARPIPQSLEVVVAYTGKPAHTQGFVDAYRALPDRAARGDHVASIVAGFVDACAHDDAASLLHAVDDARAAMHDLGTAVHKDIVTAEHAAIAAIAAQHAGAAKPSGAGGGDVAVCFVPSEKRAHLEHALDDAGFPVVRLQIGAPGVRIEP
jgi:ERG8-type phosphomevalonate kinase